MKPPTGGACKGTDPQMWFPEGKSEPQRAQLAACRALCATCPVAGECLQWALHHEQFGVWAGTTEKQRWDMRKALRISCRSPQAGHHIQGCGTISGYQRHRRAGEASCEDCRRARRLYVAQAAQRRVLALEPAGVP